MKISAVFLSFLLFPAWAFSFVRVSPTMAEYTCDPGDKVRGEFVVENTAQEDLYVSFETKEWWTNQTGLPSLSPEKWLKIKAPPQFRIKPGGRRVVRYLGRVPPDWKGGLAAMLFFTRAAKMNVRSGPVELQLRHGVPLYVYVKGGDDRVSLKLQSLSVGRKDAGSPLTFTARALNDGTVHVRPRGAIQVFAGEGLAESVSMDWGMPAFPTKDQMFLGRGKRSDWPVGDYRARVRMDYGVVFLPPSFTEREFRFHVDEAGKVEVLP